MNNKTKIIIAVILCSSLRTVNVLADDINNMKNKSNDIKQEIDNGKNEIKELKKNKESLLSDIYELEKRITELNNEVEKINSKMNNSNEKIRILETKSDGLKADLAENEEIMAKRLRIMYMNQSQSYIEILLKADGIHDFIEKAEIITSLIKYDKELMNEFKEKQEELQSTMVQVKNEKSNLESMMQTVSSKMNSLQENKQEKDALIAKIESDIDVHEAILAQQQNEFDEIIAAISNMENESKPSRGGSMSSDGQVSNGSIFSITGGNAYAITQYFEGRVSPITGKQEFHGALDIGAPYGSGVYSLKDGVVAYSGWMNGYGNVVVIDHGDISSLYAHNSELLVSEGQAVSGGQQIAKVGSTGWSTGPHIHFEIINSNGEKIDPISYYIY
ncbi:murein hydrolase activator EnvC [Clostridium faecium]|uniref:Peptidoglycan DD-metalloendopeptidase family protein n=1 Tax=Clostridium faecium TaxID=2762223 RepID=A0ABR8YRM8_9CLOT|nr:peptidoglycan DD-metalloendopeptidase family protein [Clostridium faecium]MBD8046673.1 peptidoglycan DD-metalloendopeptidase family protein [Clostridium faecium]MDU1350087.1 peptidoglycan DD-metalloendopeptidase family protein [Clostridium argentinense]